MTRMVCIHEFEPKPGVNQADLEQAVRAFVAQPLLSGWRSALLKSDRGTRSGGVGLLFEVESIEARNRLNPGDGFSEEFDQFLASHPEWMPAWEHLQSLIVQPNPWNDYLVL